MIGVIASSNVSTLINGLILDWRFNGNANDSSGNGYNGTVTNATLTTDKTGAANSAYNFAGNGKIQNNAFQSLDVYSVAFWFKVNSTATANQLVGINNSSNYLRGVFLNVADGFAVYYGTSKVRSCNAGLLKNTNWHHVVAGYDGSNAFLYFDGAAISLNAESTTSQVPNLANSITAGVFAVASPSYSNAAIDAIRVYNRMLTQSEVTELYTNSSSYI